MKYQTGFTLIELLVTISIAVIMMTVAVPGFQEFMTNNRLSSMTTNYMGALNLARSEAVKRGQTVLVCVNDKCDDSDWSKGWRVFVDQNADREHKSSDDTLLRRESALSDGYSATMKDSANTAIVIVAFDRNGVSKRYTSNAATGTTTNSATLIFCQGTQTNKAQTVIISPTAPHIGLDADKDGIPENSNGAEISSCTAPY